MFLNSKFSPTDMITLGADFIRHKKTSTSQKFKLRCSNLWLSGSLKEQYPEVSNWSLPNIHDKWKLGGLGHFQPWFAVPFYTVRYGIYRTVSIKSRHDSSSKNDLNTGSLKNNNKKISVPIWDWYESSGSDRFRLDSTRIGSIRDRMRKKEKYYFFKFNMLIYIPIWHDTNRNRSFMDRYGSWNRSSSPCLQLFRPIFQELTIQYMMHAA